MRMASHTAASVAGRPMVTDSASAAGSRPTPLDRHQVEGIATVPDQIEDGTDLAEKHRDEDEQAPHRRAPEFPDARRSWRHGHRREIGIEGVHNQALSLGRHRHSGAVRTTIYFVRGGIGKS